MRRWGLVSRGKARTTADRAASSASPKVGRSMEARSFANLMAFDDEIRGMAGRRARKRLRPVQSDPHPLFTLGQARPRCLPSTWTGARSTVLS